tara:strand:- start:3278 stop:4414 length:1137 start_codon:yes stop_codon:yes gene_type:complete
MINKNIDFSTPSLILDIDKMKKNIIKMSKYCRDKNIKLRPHAKSHKMSKLAKMQIKYGASGICVATLHEAEIMAKEKIPGILLTSPLSNNFDKKRIINLIKNTKDFFLVIDNEFSIKYLTSICKSKNIKINILIDCDIMNIGINKISRTGAHSINEVINLAKIVKNNKFLKYNGITAYAGDVQHISEYNERNKEILFRNKYLKKIIESLNKESLTPNIVSGGGTGSHNIDIENKLYTEIQPGSYIFNDVEYDQVSMDKNNKKIFISSLFVVSTIISKINNSKYIVNAGLKAFSTDSEFFPKPVGKNIPQDTSYKFMGDEHGIIILPKNYKNTLTIGEKIYIQPSHCDPTINLYSKCNIISKRKLIGKWKIDARGYGNL